MKRFEIIKILLRALTCYSIVYYYYYTVSNVISCFIQISFEGKIKPDGSEKRLYRYLMDNYEKGARPVFNHQQSVVVHIGVKLNQLLDLVSTGT